MHQVTNVLVTTCGTVALIGDLTSPLSTQFDISLQFKENQYKSQLLKISTFMSKSLRDYFPTASQF